MNRDVSDRTQGGLRPHEEHAMQRDQGVQRHQGRDRASGLQSFGVWAGVLVKDLATWTSWA